MAKTKVFVVTHWYPSCTSATRGLFVKQMATIIQTFSQVVVIHPILDENTLYSVEKSDDVITTYYIRHGGFLARRWNLIQEKRRKKRFSVFDQLQKKMLSWILLYIMFILVVIKGSMEIMKLEGRPHLFHAHVYKISFPIVILSRMTRIPAILSVHASNFLTNEISLMDYLIHVRFIPFYKLVLPVSTTLAAHLRKFHVPSKKIVIIPNPITIDDEPSTTGECPRNKLNSSPDERNLKRHPVTIGVITNFYEVKGLKVLFKSLQNLMREGITNFRLLIVGSGEYQQKYIQLAEKLGIKDRIDFLGALPHEKVIAFLREQIDFYVHPSIRETFGISLGEAIACGKPVVATNTGIAPMVVTKENGLLIPPNSVNALTEALKAMLQQHARHDPVAISRSIENQFDPPSIAQKLKKTYLKVLKPPN